MNRINTQDNTKLMTMWLMANSLKDNHTELIKLIEKNRSYFPFVNDEQLNKMKINNHKPSTVSKVYVPTFSPL